MIIDTDMLSLRITELNAKAEQVVGLMREGAKELEDSKCKKEEVLILLQTEHDDRMRQIEADLECKKNDLEAREQAFQSLKAKVEHDVDKFKHRVKLNVGGTKYETTKLTLESQESFLSSLVSGRHEVETDDGYIFIDRDGEPFRDILNFLRTKTLLVPDDGKTRERLIEELDYYQLDYNDTALGEYTKYNIRGTIVQIYDKTGVTIQTDIGRVNVLLSGVVFNGNRGYHSHNGLASQISALKGQDVKGTAIKDAEGRFKGIVIVDDKSWNEQLLGVCGDIKRNSSEPVRLNDDGSMPEFVEEKIAHVEDDHRS